MDLRSPPAGERLVAPVSALLRGLQLAVLVPSLALLLVTLYDATPAQVGWVLAVYDGAGFVAALVVPSWADRRGDYLLPMLGCALLTLLLAVALWSVTALPLAVVALVVLGAPAGVGVSLLIAHLRSDGAGTPQVTRCGRSSRSPGSPALPSRPSSSRVRVSARCCRHWPRSPCSTG